MAETRGKMGRVCNKISTLNIAGFGYLHTDNSFTLRIVAAVLLVACFCLTGYQVWDRIYWYITHPFAVDIEESRLTLSDFPTVQICNTMQFRLSKLSNISDIHSSDSEVVELLARVKSENKSVKTRALTLLKKLPEMAMKLRNMSQEYKNKYSGVDTAVYPDVCSYTLFIQNNTLYSIFCEKRTSLLSKNQMNQLEEIKKALQYVLPKTFAHTGYHGRGPVYWQSALSYWLRRIHIEYTYYGWYHGFQVMANILEGIVNFDIAQLRNTTTQSKDEFVLKCFWEDKKNCNIQSHMTEEGACYRITADQNSQKLTFMLNLQGYDRLPKMPFGVAKVSLQPPVDSELKSEQVFSVYPDQHWHIDTNRMIEDKCTFIEELECSSKMETRKAVSDDVDENTCPKDCHSVHYDYETVLTYVSLDPIQIRELVPKNWDAMRTSSLQGYSYASRVLSGDLMFYRTKLPVVLNAFRNFFYGLWGLGQSRGCSYLLNYASTLYLFTPQKDITNTTELKLKNCSDTIGSSAPAETHSVLCYGWYMKNQLLKHSESWSDTYKRIRANVRALFEYKGVKTLLSRDISEVEAAEFYRDGSIHREQVQNYIRTLTEGNKIIEHKKSGYQLHHILLKLSRLVNESDDIEEMTYFQYFKEKYSGSYYHGNHSKIKSHMLAEILKAADCANRQVWAEGMTRDELLDIILKSDVLNNKWYPDFIQIINELVISNTGIEYDKAILAAVTIRFQGKVKQTTVQSLSYTGFALLSDIGGTMGLYLGVTILVFFELFVLIIQALAAKIRPITGSENPV